MRILLTGSSGRVGRAIFGALASSHTVIGIDRSPFSTTRHVADFTDMNVLRPALAGVDAVIHTAALHAPHVGLSTDAEFDRINVQGTHALVFAAKAEGVRRFIFTSTTALYGDAVVAGQCTWVDETTVPQPKTIYHRTKLAAEALLEAEAAPGFCVRVVRMSRSFPEQPETMAVFRLHRGIDVRDVADAHVAVLQNGGADFQRYIASGRTPFLTEDCADLAYRPREVLLRRCPALVAELDRRRWPLPRTIDRVYDPGAALRSLGWQSTLGPDNVFMQHDERSIEVLPRIANYADRPGE